MEAYEIQTCIEQFGTEIYRFCRGLCPERQDAEDLYQQTFLRALESDWTLDWQKNPKALFFSLAHNLWKSNVRKQARRSSIAPCSALEQEMEDTLPGGENIEENFCEKELRREVSRVIAALPDKIRIPVILYYRFDFSIEQVAGMIKKPPGTVKSRLFKGRSLIRKRLEEFGYEA